MLFIVGSACFAVGSLPGYSDAVGELPDAITYFVGSIFFTAAAYLQYVECISAPLDIGPAAPPRRRLIAIEARRIDWWATFIQFVGTLCFNVTTFTALDANLTPKKADLVVWTPDALGWICFLIASELAFAEAGHAWLSWRPRSMGWRIAAINLLGSVFFGASAIAGWIQPATGDVLDAALDTSGTFWVRSLPGRSRVAAGAGPPAGRCLTAICSDHYEPGRGPPRAAPQAFLRT